MEKHLNRLDQKGFLQQPKFMEVEKARKVNSQCFRDEDGTLQHDKDLII